ncbi:MAG: aldehyde dehydrogenase family protein [Caulobacteraceae bacterium]
MRAGRKLERLTAGMAIPWGGDNLALVDEALAAAFRSGDRLIVVQEAGDLLRVPAEAAAVASEAVERARAAFDAMIEVSDAAITDFFARFASELADETVWRKIAAANAADVAAAQARDRSTTRLRVTDAMRADMIAGLDDWRDAPPARDRVVERVDHPGWSVELATAPLGVVGFVFEGRPNVFADAAGVIRGGNTVVFRIGSDALGTARAIATQALAPSLAGAGLPGGAAVLLDSADRAAGWAMFSDRRVALAVARGSGRATAQLGAVARQAGIPVSLHGTGGAWLIADVSADRARFVAAVANSLDRKVCNTLNVCCLARERAGELTPVFIEALWRAGEALGHGARLHLARSDAALVPEPWLRRRVRARRPEGEIDEPFIELHDAVDLGREWEWEQTPEVWLTIAGDLDQATELFNAASPRFIASLIAEDGEAQRRFYAGVDAPFVGDGFTRWVDGQYAFGKPELGLSNWQGGRLLARGGVLSGDGVTTLRARMRQSDPDLAR